MVFFILRHSETSKNLLDETCGNLDALLTLRGVTQAQSIGFRMAELKDIDFSEYKFISSPQIRSKHTLQIVLEVLGLLDKNKIIADPLLRTKSKGLFEGLTNEEIKKQFPGELEKKSKDFWNYTPPESTDSKKQEYERAAKLYEKYRDKKVVLCGHSGICSTLVKVAEGVTAEEMHNLLLNNIVPKFDQDYFYKIDGERVEKI